MLAKASRLFHTLWPLKLIQHWGLFYYRVVRRLLPFKPTTTKATKVDFVTSNFHVYQPQGWKGRLEFEFLNRAAKLNAETWQAEEQSLLWHYNLHYFDHLNAKNNEHTVEDEAELLLLWWQFHKPLQGIAWDPYPSSLRAVNLCKWGWRHNRDFEFIPHDTWLAILDRHYQEIKRKLEYHIQANHLFANLKALWFLQAALPEYRAKDGKWLNKKVVRELGVQFDTHGGHFELSPMYHRIMLWDLLDMLALGKQVPDFKEVSVQIKEVASNALTWASALSHPDKEVAFFNDGAIGIAPSWQDLKGYAKQLKAVYEGYENAEYSGYVVQTVNKAKLICDVAEVGPTFQPGHAHADTLSFELSLGLQRVIVNSGTSEYGVNEERLRQRSTAAHNTVVFENRNSSDVWSGFRVGRQAQIINKKVHLSCTESNIEATHNGYKPALHHRKWTLSPCQLVVKDSWLGRQATAEKKSYLHFHPNVKLTKENEFSYVLEWSTGKAKLSIAAKDANVTIEDSTWHPGFGKVIKNKKLVLTYHNPKSEILINWDAKDGC
ncbi:heparinase [Aliidiomarina taiwanensis]|uniref:Heparinase n=1 Tax=Aliidiomarina taiwanensis TaxID=946228 RepID=A0A432WTL9_9GAMM|nr:heparinase II/III family protein [Aliidiomarina taiwanensis]RUO37113.1 heparinase [Aliidiomarina taiwanensis]